MSQKSLPVPLFCSTCDEIFNCLDEPSTNQDCQNCSKNPEKPCQLCYPCFLPFALLIDIITYPCIFFHHEYYKCCHIVEKV